MSSVNDNKLLQIHVFISGNVQGVGFRWATQRTADRIGVKGWVRNTPDGRVEFAVEGNGSQIDELLRWAQQGPGMAAVSKVDVVERKFVEEPSFARFEIRH